MIQACDGFDVGRIEGITPSRNDFFGSHVYEIQAQKASLLSNLVIFNVTDYVAFKSA